MNNREKEWKRGIEELGRKGRRAESSRGEEAWEEKVEEASKEVCWRHRVKKERRKEGEERRVEVGVFHHHGLKTSMSG